MHIQGIKGIHAVPFERLTVLIHYRDQPQCHNEGGTYERPNWVQADPGNAPELVATKRIVDKVELVYRREGGKATVIEIYARDFQEILTSFGWVGNSQGAPAEESTISWEW